MTGIKRRLAVMLAGMVLFSCVTAPAENTGRDTVGIQESVVTREGETAGTLKEHFLLLAQLAEKEEVRNLMRMEDVSTIANEVVWKVLVWMARNRPVTMKILAELGLAESELRNVGKLWDSAERVYAAFQEYSGTEQGKRIITDLDALLNDEVFTKSLKSLQALLTSEDLGNILTALKEVTESDRTGWTEGTLTKEALDRNVDQTTFTGSLLLALFNVLDQTGWAMESLPDLLMNENLWQFLKDISEGSEELDRTMQEEFSLLAEDTEMTAFLEQTFFAGLDLIKTLRDTEDGTHLQEETEVPAP